MITQSQDIYHEQVERLCEGYRAGIEEPAFSSADRLLLRAASRSARYRTVQRRLCSPSAVLLVALLAVLGSAAAGWVELPGSNQSGPIVPPLTALVRAAPSAHPPYARGAPNIQMTRTAIATVPVTAWVTSAPAITPPPTPSPLLIRSVQAVAPTLPAASVGTVGTVGTVETLASAGGIIDLNAPGALASLRFSRPQDYRRIVAILAGIAGHPQRDVPHWLRTTFDASNVVYQPLWLTSFPPKRRLSFSLEGRGYLAVLTITNQGARVFPVEGAARGK